MNENFLFDKVTALLTKVLEIINAWMGSKSIRLTTGEHNSCRL